MGVRSFLDGLNAPHNLAQTVGTFALGYALWQPTAQLLFGLLVGRPPWPGINWVWFATTAAILGAAVGVQWFRSKRLSDGPWRRISQAACQMVAFTATVTGWSFSPSTAVAWAAAALVTGAALGAVLQGIAELVRRRKTPSAAA